MEDVALKNGARAARALVAATILSLEGLLENNPIAFYELVMKCRNRNHQLFGNTGQILKKYSLIQSDGNVHDAIRNIVLSAVEGDGLDMALGSPVAHQTEYGNPASQK